MRALAQIEANRQYRLLERTLRPTITVARDSVKESVTSSTTRQYRAAVSDEALMAGFASGNVKAFEQLYLRHKDPLLRFFIRQVSNRSEAEELFQDSWQGLIKHSKSYKSSAKFTTYLYHIARTRLIDHYRKNGRQQEFTQDNDGWENMASGDAQHEPEKQLSHQQSRQQFIQALEQLPALQREVVILKLDTGMTVSDIAEIVQQDHEAVKSRLRYGMDKLKHYLRDLNENSVEVHHES